MRNAPKLLTPAAAALAVALLAPSAALAWDRVGHYVVARIAWEEMSPEARQRAAEILASAPADADLASLRPATGSAESARRTHFYLAAYWPDIVRDRDLPERYEKYHRGNWHYINYFWEQDDEGNARPRPDIPLQETSVVERLPVLEARLADPARSDAEKAIDLAWVLHLVGDIHQPLHTSGRVTETEPAGDRGGNDFQLAGDSSLHWFWDRQITLNHRKWFWQSEDARVRRAAASIARRYPPPDEGELTPGEYDAWARAGLRTTQTVAYPPTLARGDKPSRAYRAAARDAAEPAAALAGYRLAELLNRVLGE